jgi:DNA mismatch repair protein MutL
MSQLKKGNAESQAILSPIIVDLDPRQLSAVKSNTELLLRLGFIIEEFGKNSVLISSYPVIFKNSDKQIILDIIEELDKDLVSAEKEKKLIMKACKASVKANEYLTLPQMIKIIEALNTAENPYTCPHGRPVMINISKYELEKMFKRIQ